MYCWSRLGHVTHVYLARKIRMILMKLGMKPRKEADCFLLMRQEENSYHR